MSNGTVSFSSAKVRLPRGSVIFGRVMILHSSRLVMFFVSFIVRSDVYVSGLAVYALRCGSVALRQVLLFQLFGNNSLQIYYFFWIYSQNASSY